MGFYVQGPNFGKEKHIAEKFHAVEVTQEQARQALHEGKGVVCVLTNALFEAAGFAYDEREFDSFADPTDHRPKKWLVMDRQTLEIETNLPKHLRQH